MNNNCPILAEAKKEIRELEKKLSRIERWLVRMKVETDKTNEPWGVTISKLAELLGLDVVATDELIKAEAADGICRNDLR